MDKETPKKNKKKAVIETNESMNADESPVQHQKDTSLTNIEEPDIGSRPPLKKLDDFAMNVSKKDIRACLKSFKDSKDLLEFCYEYSEELYKDISDETHFRTIVIKIRQHCDSHNCYDHFWQTIEEERHHLFLEHHPTQRKTKYRAGKSERDQFDNRLESIEDDISKNNEASQSHPLSGDDGSAILNWFCNELDEDDQSLVLTVGLFQGLNRNYIPHIAEAIKPILFKTSDDHMGV